MHVCALGRGGCWLSTVFINLSSYTRSIVHIEATNNKVILEEFVSIDWSLLIRNTKNFGSTQKREINNYIYPSFKFYRLQLHVHEHIVLLHSKSMTDICTYCAAELDALLDICSLCFLLLCVSFS